MSEQTTSEEPTLSICEKRKLLFTMLSVLWLFPSAGAIWIILRDSRNWRTGGRWTEALSSIRLEDWTALLLLLAHVIFLVQAIRYRRYCRNPGSG